MQFCSEYSLKTNENFAKLFVNSLNVSVMNDNWSLGAWLTAHSAFKSRLKCPPSAAVHDRSLLLNDRIALSTRSIWKMLGPFATASRLTPIHQVSLAVLSRAACASMSTTSPTTTTTTTTRDRGDRYGPMEWAQWTHVANHFISPTKQCSAWLLVGCICLIAFQHCASYMTIHWIWIW